MKPRVYLDVCTLERPFDDLTQRRIREEAAAVITIMQRISGGDCEWISSEIVDLEIAANPDAEMRDYLLNMIQQSDERVVLESDDVLAGTKLAAIGIKIMDSLHLVLARVSHCDVFLTTDDALIRAYRRIKPQWRMKAMNPVAWLREFAP